MNWQLQNQLATPESAGIDADQGGSNMEAYSMPKPPIPGTKFDNMESARRSLIRRATESVLSSHFHAWARKG